ncbi:hypothetical protein IWW36_000050 [Coemansia brasiliensis]|uniref:ABC transporter domain-containing protein n=1 Tax=Coemansia brasiliensis TaxID=2650707 RepID=A0A9W8II29_9FUNG|nr:hypothetical protein IWW36_000050 [Coemansia brasiliensis]
MLLQPPTTSIISAFAFYVLELHDAFAVQPLMFRISTLCADLVLFIRITLSCNRRLRRQPDDSVAILDLAAKYASSQTADHVKFDRSKRAYVLQAILKELWRPILVITLGEAFLGIAEIWAVISITRIFALIPTHIGLADIMRELSVHFGFKVLVALFKAYHYEAKDELKTRLQNILYYMLCKQLVTTYGSNHDSSIMADLKSFVILPFVNNLFQAVNCLSPISGVLSNIAISYSLLGWRSVAILAIVLVISALSQWLFVQQSQKHASAKKPTTLSVRIKQLLPSLLAFKMLAFEDAIFQLKAHDFYNVSLGFGYAARSVAAVTKGLGAYLAAICLSATVHVSAAPLEIVRTLALLQQMTTSIEKLVGSLGIYADIIHLERTIESKLASGICLEDTSDSTLSRNPKIQMTGAIFKRQGCENFAVYADSLLISSGQLIAVTGAIGAGKSTLLLAMLGELNICSGKSCVEGTVAYVGQKPWIMNATIRENVLFGRTMDEELYRQVLALCCLQEDLARMTDGDSTLISNQGSTLSGGQQARLALARALYSEADIYLLDDTLAELDPSVQSTIWKNVLSSKGFLKGKIRILVTKERKYVSQCNAEICVVNGYARLTAEVSTNSSTPSPSNSKPHNIGDKVKATAQDTALETVSFSKMTTGSTKMQGLKYFVRTCGIWSLASALIMGVALFVVPRCIYERQIALLYRESTGGAANSIVLSQYAQFLLVGTAVDVAFVWISFATEQGIYIRFNRPKIANVLLRSYARAKMSEIWRITDRRIVSVIQTSEHALMVGVHMFVMHWVSYSASILYSMYKTYQISLPAIPLLIASCAFLSYAQSWGTDMLRQIQLLKMQKLDHKQAINVELFSGSLTVRAFRAYSYFSSQMMQLDITVAGIERLANAIINVRQVCKIVLQQLIALLMIGVVAVKVRQGAAIDTASIRMYYEMLTESLPLLVSIFTISDDITNHAQALQEFCDHANLETEGSRHIHGSDIKDQRWPPVHGSIRFKGCTMSYGNSKRPALNSISVFIKDKEKIGIVGRTGSGKSSLINALLRIVELEEGKITIGGMDISQLGVHDLRQQISVVPQTGALFEGTLRENLDPFSQHSETEVRAAIRDAKLADFEPDTQIESCGNNLSAGQKKLVAICRAILQRRKILILDEAGASIDKETEQAVQEILATKFQNSTVLTIAHQVEKVGRSSSRIVVMDQGKIAEFGARKTLLAANGIYAELERKERGEM